MVHAYSAITRARSLGWPLDAALSTVASCYGWQLPDFVSSRVSTAFWALVDAPQAVVPLGDAAPAEYGSDQPDECSDTASDVGLPRTL